MTVPTTSTFLFCLFVCFFFTFFVNVDLGFDLNFVLFCLCLFVCLFVCFCSRGKISYLKIGRAFHGSRVQFALALLGIRNCFLIVLEIIINYFYFISFNHMSSC